jgi:hypothetical protein
MLIQTPLLTMEWPIYLVSYVQVHDMWWMRISNISGCLKECLQELFLLLDTYQILMFTPICPRIGPAKISFNSTD